MPGKQFPQLFSDVEKCLCPHAGMGMGAELRSGIAVMAQQLSGMLFRAAFIMPAVGAAPRLR
jgi:hypothetical protein